VTLVLDATGLFPPAAGDSLAKRAAYDRAEIRIFLRE